MRRELLLVFAVLSLAACRAPDQENAAANPPAPAPAPTASAPAAAPAPTTAEAHSVWCKTGCGELPQGVVIAIPHPLHSDRSYSLPNGERHRQVAFEFTEGTAESTMEALDQSMRAAGFESVPKPARADGVLPGLYKKADFGNVNVWVNPVVGGKAVDPAAKGVFGFDYASTQAGQ